jgi:hypothetical protein
MVEYLPRVLDIPNLISKSAPIMISKFVPKAGKQALQKLTDRQIIEIDPKKSYHVKRLHFSAPVAQVLDTTTVPWVDGVFLDVARLNAFRERCLEIVQCRPAGWRKIFIRRKSEHRNLLNEEQLEAIAKGMGFEVLDIETLSWDQQVRLFASAKVVVGAGGAIMANYIFLPNGSNVVSLTSSHLANFPLPAYMASVAGASFTYLTGMPRFTRGGRRNAQQIMHSGYRIPKSRFKKVLSKLI